MFFQRLDRDVLTSQPLHRMLCTTFVGCVVAVVAVLGAGGVGETSSMSRSARENAIMPAALALTNVRAASVKAAKVKAAKVKATSKVNLGPATQTNAEALVTVDGGVDQQHVTSVLSMLSVDWRLIAAGWTINFKKERNGYLGLTLVRERKVEIYVRDGRPLEGIAHDLAHELGHVADVMAGSDESRAAFLRARRLSASTPWWTCSGCTDLQVGAGDFAETFAMLIAPSYKFYSELGQSPSAAQLVDVTAALPASIAVALRPTADLALRAEG